MDFDNPTPEMFCIEDVAHALANKTRYNGHTKWAYSVAQHCCYIAMYLDTIDGLGHDFPEAYVGDLPGPMKRMPELAGYNVVEERIYAAGATKLGFSAVIPHEVEVVDKRILINEIRDLFGPQYAADVARYGEPLEELKIERWTAEEAEERYLKLYCSFRREQMAWGV